MTIMLSTATVNPMPTAGAIVGTLSLFQNGVVVAGATFTLDDTNFLVVSGSTLTIAQPLPANVVPVKVYAVVNGAIVDEAQFQIVVLTNSPNGSLIAAPKGSLVSRYGVWTWGQQVAGTTFYVPYLNNVQAVSSGYGSELLIDNSGTVYLLGGSGNWSQYYPPTATSAAYWKSLGTSVQP
jgi:hypothetical protein